MSALVSNSNSTFGTTGESGCQTYSPDLVTRKTHIVHVTSSRFFGGPERQMLELACELSPEITSSFISFKEGGHCQAFLKQVQSAGFTGLALQRDMPHLYAAAQELKQQFKNHGATVVCTHGYKASILGLWAARQAGIPVIAVSRGWTGESRKVRLYEHLDRLALRAMDRVICVSEGQAAKVREAKVAEEKVIVIHNAIRTDRFLDAPNVAYRTRLNEMFVSPPRFIIGAAGRLSPEKGFDDLIEACRLVRKQNEVDLGVVLFGEGALHDDLHKQIHVAGLESRFLLAGFASDLDCYMPHFDLFVQSSHTEGLPNVLLEAMAAGVPVVATDVGGTSELVVPEKTGFLEPANDPLAIADAIVRVLTNKSYQFIMQQEAPKQVARHFTFSAQAIAYREVFSSVLELKLPLV